MEKIITGKQIVKTFGQGEEKTNALNGVDIEIAKGEFVAVMGPSGCGKSSLLFALSGTDDVSQGAVYLAGTDLTQLSENSLADTRRTKMGFVFQQPTMLKNLNLLDNIILPSVQGSRKNTAAIIQKAKSLMEKTGIAKLAQRDVTEVSGGQLQRAGICRALMSEPEILFADEPTGALNSKAAEEIMDLLAEINRGGTAILIVTHDAKVAARADRILFMKDGAIISEVLFPRSESIAVDSRIGKIDEQMRQIGI